MTDIYVYIYIKVRKVTIYSKKDTESPNHRR